MLMGWDGLAEAENHIMERERQARRKSVTAQAVSTMVAEMAGTQQPGERAEGNYLCSHL